MLKTESKYFVLQLVPDKQREQFGPSTSIKFNPNRVQQRFSKLLFRYMVNKFSEQF